MPCWLFCRYSTVLGVPLVTRCGGDLSKTSICKYNKIIISTLTDGFEPQEGAIMMSHDEIHHEELAYAHDLG